MNQDTRLRSTGCMLLLGLVTGAPFLAQPSLAGVLEGRIVGANGEPRPYARVNAVGPQQMVTVTEQDGSFRIDGAGGVYLIRVIEGKRQAELHVTIPATGTLAREFRVDW